MGKVITIGRKSGFSQAVQDVLDRMTSPTQVEINAIEVYVDAKDLENGGSGNHKLRVKVEYPNPDNLNLNKLSPETIEIKLN